MFQYLAPTLAFAIAIVVYDEPFTRGHLLSFVCVWLALSLYLWDSLQRAPRIEVTLRGGEAGSPGGSQ
jgi:chloramphenicol-sensitive protein RarD